MARGLGSIGLRNLRRRKLRYALTALGIVLGVANVFGVLVTNASTNRLVGSSSASRSGGADVVAYPSDQNAPLTPEILAKLRKLPQTRATTEIFQAFDTVKRRRVSVLLAGVDAVGAHEFVRARLERGRMFRRGRPEAVLSERASQLTGLGIGDTWTTNLSHYRRGVRWNENGLIMRLYPHAPSHLAFRITGIVSDPLGAGDDFSAGSFMSLEYVRTILGPAVANEVRFYLDHGVDGPAWATEHEGEIPGAAFRAIGPATDFRRFISVLQGAMSGAAAIAVFVGAFLIYLTFSMNVIERTRLLGTLHAIGAKPAQVTRSILAEALALGTFATAVGLLLGLAAARGLLPLTARVMQVGTPPLVITPGALIAGVAVGMVATLAGSFVPARRAGRISPVEAIRGDQTLVAKPSKAWVAGAILVVASTASSVATRGIEAPSIFAQTGTLALLLGSVLLLPPLVGPLARTARRAFRRRSKGLGDVAVMHLVRERSHAAYTLGLVMVVLAMMLAVAAANGSVGRAGEEWVDKRFGADLVASNQGITSETEAKVARVPGVTGVTSAAFGQLRMTRPKAVVNLVIIDPGSFFDIAGFPWSEGDDASAKAALARGGNVLLPAPMATSWHLHRGGRVTVAGPSGPATFRIAGTYTALGGGREIGVVAGVKDAPHLWRGELSRNVLYINAATRSSVATVRSAVDDALVNGKPVVQRPEFGPQGGVGRSGYYFITGAQIKAEAHRQLRSYFALFYAVLFVAVLVGLLGLANTMAMGVLRRFREIGIVQAVGATPRNVARMVQAETALLVTVAFVLSIALGTLVSWLIVKGVGSIVGFAITFVFPWRWIPILGVLAAVIALVSSAAPARRASRLTPVEALRYE